MLRGWHQLSSQWEYEEKLLVPAFNMHQLSSYDFYRHSPMPLKKIEDQKVLQMTKTTEIQKRGIKLGFRKFFQSIEKQTKNSSYQRLFSLIYTITPEEKDKIKRTFTRLYNEKGFTVAAQMLRDRKIGQTLQSKKGYLKSLEKGIQKLYESISSMSYYSKLIFGLGDEVSFYHDEGVCRGASLWFIHLYLKSQKYFKNPKAHLIALAEEFKTGIPKQGAILQSFFDTKPILQWKKTEVKEAKISLYELDEDIKSAYKKTASLTPGIYMVAVKKHAFVYVKTKNSGEYLWDPNIGLLSLST